MEPFLTPEKNKTYREMVLHPKISVGGFVHHRPVSAILGRDAGKNLERSAARAGRAVPVRRGSRRADRGFFGPARQRGGGRGGELRDGRFAVAGGRQAMTRTPTCWRLLREAGSRRRSAKRVA